LKSVTAVPACCLRLAAGKISASARRFSFTPPTSPARPGSENACRLLHRWQCSRRFVVFGDE
jgi:hypothetical protein